MSLVCWSGGCDSTLLLYALAHEATPWKPVRALNLRFDQVPCAEQQAAARRRILAYMRSRGLHVEYHEAVVHNRKGTFVERGNGLIQAQLWLSMAVSYLNHDEDLFMGYIRSDDMWHYRHDYGNGFQHLQLLAGKTGNLFMPLEWLTKADVILLNKEHNLLDKVWWCEGEPVSSKDGDAVTIDQVAYEPCHKCSSCLTHDTAALAIETFGEARFYPPSLRSVLDYVRKARV